MDLPTLPPSAGSHNAGRDDSDVPGVVVAFSGDALSARVMTLVSGPLKLGRHDGSAGTIDDGSISRRHTVVAFEGGRCADASIVTVSPSTRVANNNDN